MSENEKLRRLLKGWADWYRFATRDDDNEYLNGKGWDDAEALADSTFAALSTPCVEQDADEVELVARALARHDDPKKENWWPSYEGRARAALSAIQSRDAGLREAICNSIFVTSVSEGNPDSAKRRYRMELHYADLNALHSAHDAILRARRADK